MTLIRTYSVYKDDIPMYEEFKEYCKTNKLSMSNEITTLMAMYVQAKKEGKIMGYREKIC